MQEGEKMGNPVEDFLKKLREGSKGTKSSETPKTEEKASSTTKSQAIGQARTGVKPNTPVQKTQAEINKEEALRKENQLKRKAEFQQQLSEQKQRSLQAQKEAISKKTNQDIINAAYKVADELKLVGGPWPLLRAAGWGHLTDKRGDLYKGPAIDEIDALTPEQKAALKRVLGL